MGPEIVQHPLSRADGSAVFSDGLYTIIAGANGPVDVQRRDELPEEAAIEINIRPSSGSDGPRERWLETVVQSVLKSILLVHMHPRTLFQITLQVTKDPSTKLQKTASDISLLPSLLNAAFAALVDGGFPLATTMVAALASVQESGEVISEPKEKEIAGCKSIHAMAYNTRGEQLMDESCGSFNMETWEKVANVAQEACAAALSSADEDEAMVNGTAQKEPWLRQALEKQVTDSNAWRDQS
jgi:exosome complex component RRP46